MRATLHSEPPLSRAKNLDIEALRGYAVAITFVAHLITLVPEWQNWVGYFWLGGGVDLFFCISGFVITCSLLEALDQAPTFRQYANRFWIRRVLRLWPAALFWSSSTLLIVVLTGDLSAAGGRFDVFLTWLTGGFSVANFYIYACAQGSVGICTGNALWHYWSLSLEEQFYLLMPMILFFVRPRPILIPVFLAAAFAQAMSDRPWGSLLWFIRSDAILYGCTIGLVMRYGYDRPLRDILSSKRRFLQAVLGLLLVLLIVLATPLISRFYMGFVALSAALIVFVVAPDQRYLASTDPRCRIAAYAGSRSYSLYLVHLPVLAFARDIILAAAPTALTSLHLQVIAVGIALTVSIALAEFSYRWIEMPLRRYGRRITSPSLYTDENYQPQHALPAAAKVIVTRGPARDA